MGDRKFDPDNTQRWTANDLVFPETKYLPSFLTKTGVSATVSFAVSKKLLLPPTTVSLRPAPVPSTSVPEATVNEHSESPAPEN